MFLASLGLSTDVDERRLSLTHAREQGLDMDLVAIATAERTIDKAFEASSKLRCTNVLTNEYRRRYPVWLAHYPRLSRCNHHHLILKCSFYDQSSGLPSQSRRMKRRSNKLVSSYVISSVRYPQLTRDQTVDVRCLQSLWANNRGESCSGYAPAWARGDCGARRTRDRVCSLPRALPRVGGPRQSRRLSVIRSPDNEPGYNFGLAQRLQGLS